MKARSWTWTGEQADVFLYERGWTVFAMAGKLLPVIGPNPNSGLVLKVGGGYMRHKVRVQTQKNVVPQLEDEYLEGYDRLSAGPAALGYVGYQHLEQQRADQLPRRAGVDGGLHPGPARLQLRYGDLSIPAAAMDLLTGIACGLDACRSTAKR